MSARTQQILARFPAHLEPTRAGKQLSHVVDALAVDLDRLTSDLGGVRNAHRLANAPTTRDLGLLATLHGLGDSDFELPLSRLAQARELADALELAVASSDLAARNGAAETLFAFFGLAEGTTLEVFALPVDGAGDPDLNQAASRLVHAVRQATDSKARLAAMRRRLTQLCKSHALGNGTVRALIETAASALDQQLDEAANARAKQAGRPRARLQLVGAPGNARFGYLVVARPLMQQVLRNGTAAFINNGPNAVTTSNFVRVSWDPVAGARDYLVYRLAGAGAGLITPTPLPAEATSLDDTGLVADGLYPAPSPEFDDAFFHSTDRYWHASFVRENVHLVQTLEAPAPPNLVPVAGQIAGSELARLLGTTSALLYARAEALCNAGNPIDAVLGPDLAMALGQQLGKLLVVSEGTRVARWATRLDATAAALFAGLAALSASGSPSEIAFEEGSARELAAEFGFLVHNPLRFPLSESITVLDLSRRTQATLQRINLELVKQGIVGATLETRLSFDEAAFVVTALGLLPTPTRRLRLSEPTTVGSLATSSHIAAPSLLRDLALLGHTGLTSDSLLDFEQIAAVMARHVIEIEAEPETSTSVIGLEENPPRKEELEPTERVHAECFSVFRRGFERTALEVRIGGILNRTHGPMLVNRDEGRGVGFDGFVPEGASLVFQTDGRVLLDGADVTARAYAWRGACFAGNDDNPGAPRDFVFAGPGAAETRLAKFAVGLPEHALDSDFAFPHTQTALPLLGIGTGKTRFAAFVQEAHFANLDTPTTPAPDGLAPRTKTGFLDASVFAPSPIESRSAAALIGLSWSEHEAYAVRVLIPARFARYDRAGALTVAERVALALQRVRPLGVRVWVEYQDDSWILGSSPLADAAASDPITRLMGGSMLTEPPPA